MSTPRRSVIDLSNFADRANKFQSPWGDTTFQIAHGTIIFTVDRQGNVLAPVGTKLDYSPEDFMKGLQSGKVAKVKDFLTVDLSMDIPGSKNW